MRSDFLSRAAGLRSRLARAGVALLLSALLPAQAVVIAAPSSMGPQAPGASKAPAASPWTGPQFQTLSAEIDPAVLDAFDKSDQVSYLVLMRTRADFTSVAASARASASPSQAEVMARSAVISSLREAAETTQASLLSELEKAQGAGQVSHLKSYWIANMISVTSNKAVMEKIAKRHDVEKIYPNGEIHLVGGEKMRAEASDAPASGSPEISTIEWNINRVGAPAVWEQFGIDGTGAVVASLDTGVQWTHEALQNQYRGFNPATGQVDSTYSWFDAVQGQAHPYDDNGHGTHTTGTMVGRDPAGANEIGVAPGAKWIAAKIFDAFGIGSIANILAAGQWVMAPGGDPSEAPDVVNNSWGGGPGMDEVFRAIVAAWRAAGIVPIFSNGNDGPDPGSVGVPANYPESIGVGATDSIDRLPASSSRGPSPYGEIKPDLSAPGHRVRSAVPGGGYEGGWSGTSMSAPHVAGAVALLRQADASLTVDEIEEILLASADPMTNAEYTSVPNNGYGHGMLNSLTAVTMVTNGAGSVSGRVLTSGDDLTAPVITHTEVTEGFRQTDTLITAQVTDDVSVTAVYLRFRLPGMRWWGVVDMAKISGDQRNGTYTGLIPAEIAGSDSLEYYLEAVDSGNNHAFHGSSRSPHVITLLNGITPGYLQDFEGPAAGWLTGGTPEGLWQFGEPTSGPNAAHSGTRVAATNLSGNYPNYASAYLISPPIDLSGGGPAFMHFHHWYQTDEWRDWGIVAVTPDGGTTWNTTHTFTGQNGSYEEVVIDLTPYAGNPRVFVAFELFSDAVITGAGWYIDDVRITGMTTDGTTIDRRQSVKASGPPMRNGAKPAQPSLSSITLPKSTATYRVDKVSTSGVGIMALPVDATVTVLETGRVVRTSPNDGSYLITLPAGTYTLQAEAYGYYPSARTVEITDGTEISANFVLEPVPRGLLSGTVTSRRNGEPIAGARVRLAEDPMVPEATTDANGHFTLDLLAGSYTLEVRHSIHYPTSMAVDVPVDGSVSVDVEMIPFVGQPGEIGYDDGLAEDAYSFWEAGNGLAVRMSPERLNQTTFISAARFFLWDTSHPVPGGNSFHAAIFAANPDGSPGAILAGPVQVTNAVRGAWNEVDFSAFGLTVTGDFYVGYTQDQPFPYTPSLGLDRSSNLGRTWEFWAGRWYGSMWGNAMIRAVVSYGVGAPTITAPADGSFTNSPTVDVQGMGVVDTAVRIYLDGELAGEAMPAADGSFSVPIAMEEGAHVITAATTVPDGGTTDPSAPVHLVVDLTAPELVVTSPVEGATLGSRLITVAGQTSDANLDGVLVNGTAATVGEDGHFSVEIIGREGTNAINIAASDRAGNQTVVTRNVQVDSVAPVLSNLQPSSDHDLSPGDTLTVSFDSEPGLALAAFVIVYDGNAGNRANVSVGSFNLEPGETAMTETSPGHYEATWTVPEGTTASAGYVEFRGVDAIGNTTRATAPGVLHISPGDGGDGGGDDGGGDDGGGGQEPVTAIIVGPAEAKVQHIVTFDGTQSSSPKGIVSYAWDMGDGKKYSQAAIRHVWRKLGTYTVTLTVTDGAGVSATTTMTVTVVR